MGSRELVEAVLTDHRTAPISEAERSLFSFVESVNARPHEVTQADVETLRAAGWTTEAVYDAVTVCALFNFYNRWIDATGVRAMPAEAFQASGERLASLGYLPPGVQ